MDPTSNVSSTGTLAPLAQTSPTTNSGVAYRRGIKPVITPLNVPDVNPSSSVPTLRDMVSMYGWEPTEWDQWSTDLGKSLHTNQNRPVLLGMVNFGNSCYANSVLQALYHCQPFRDAIMSIDKMPLHSPLPSSHLTSASCMKDALTRLFHSMALSSVRLSTHDRHTARRDPGPLILDGSVDQDVLKTFLVTLHQNCNLFDSTMHHDAHEFLNFILNQVCEDMIDKRQRRANKAREQSYTPLTACFNSPTISQRTYIHHLFQGILTNETRCLSCETITNRDEEFFDLSINVEHNTSVASSLRLFSEREMLSGRNKFFCDTCSSLQEAEKRMKIKQPPNILALHLKRFKWSESNNVYVKHASRVVFPLDLRLFNTTDQTSQPDQLYELSAIVVHIGSGAHQGHYVSIVRIGTRWAIFDDEDVSFIRESDISKYFGDAPEIGSAYVLFYQAVDEAPLPKTIPQPSVTTTFPSPTVKVDSVPASKPMTPPNLPKVLSAQTSATALPVPTVVIKSSQRPGNAQPPSSPQKSNSTVRSAFSKPESLPSTPPGEPVSPYSSQGKSLNVNAPHRHAQTMDSNRERRELNRKSWLGFSKLGRMLS